ncbi:HAMP domain-containing sensor histidine kinase [Chitinophaga pollutisoli]|uniref:histidine kinase n=1 Tax=Chitinophaga pollutisoli TaxID=3133966 RepID=A0ABZ2YT68_9BACT
MPASDFSVKTFFFRLLNIGITPDMPFIEARRTRLLNLLTVPWIPGLVFFAVTNFFQERYLLSFLNCLNVACSVGTVIFTWKQRYLSARLFIIISSIIIYTVTALIYRNGVEFFLLNILIVTVLVYDNKWLILSLSAVMLSCFLAVRFSWINLSPELPVPHDRIVFNVVWGLSFIVMALSYFKRVHDDYENEKEVQRQALVALNRDKEKLFSIIAHDIRGPLSTLEMLLDMFRKGEYPEEDMKDAADELYKKVASLAGTMDNMLRWSMGQMKGIRVKPVHASLANLTDEIVNLFENTIREKEIHLKVEIPADCWVYADRDQVSVILRNLLSNAVKFSYPGGEVRMSAITVEGQVTFRVQDNGMGIPPEKLPQLFSFKSAPGYGTKGERGSGLGLLLCQEFTVQNKGQLTASSIPGKGTQFTLTLPAGKPALVKIDS